LKDKTIDILYKSIRITNVLGIKRLEHQTDNHQGQHLFAHIHTQRKFIRFIQHKIFQQRVPDHLLLDIMPLVPLVIGQTIFQYLVSLNQLFFFG